MPCYINPICVNFQYRNLYGFQLVWLKMHIRNSFFKIPLHFDIHAKIMHMHNIELIQNIHMNVQHIND